MKDNGPVAQQVERSPHKGLVAGLCPARPTKQTQDALKIRNSFESKAGRLIDTPATVHGQWSKLSTPTKNQGAYFANIFAKRIVASENHISLCIY